MRSYGQNFNPSMNHAYTNHPYGESSNISKFFSSISRTKNYNFKRSLSSKALFILIATLLVAITGYILSNQNTGKNSVNQLNTLTAASKTVGISNTLSPAPKQQATTNTVSSTTSTSSNNSTTIDVNGQTVTVPENGNYSQTNSSGSSTSSVTVSNHSSSVGSGVSNTSSTSVNVNSNSQ